MSGPQLTVEEALRQGIAHHQTGRLGEAEQLYRAILQAVPDHADANHNLGVIAVQVGQTAAGLPHFRTALLSFFNQGRHGDAEALARSLVTQYPDDGFGWKVLGALLKQSARQNEALHSMRKAVELLPGDAEAHNNLGILLQELGLPQEAEEHCRIAIGIQDFAKGHYNLGLVLKAQGRLPEAHSCFLRAIELDPGYAKAYFSLGEIQADSFQNAESCFRKAIEINPDYAEAHFTLANVLRGQGRYNEAVESYKAALARKQDYPEAMHNLSIALKVTGKLVEAEYYCRRVIEFLPDFAEAYRNLGDILLTMQRPDNALEAYRKALEIHPNYPEVHNNMGLALKDLGRFGEAEACFWRAIEISPEFDEAQNNLGAMLCHRGELRKGVEIFRTALARNPLRANMHGNLIFYLDMLPELGTQVLQHERKVWAERHADPLFRKRQFTNVPDPERILRIGYVSGDFNEHSAAYGFGSLLGNHDRTSFEIYAYSNSKKSDAVTEHLKKGVTQWRNIDGLPDQSVAERILQDNIDILVDLSGHTAGNRLLVFARKPAPIQISAMGYPTGTGMKAMDALFVDRVVVPPEEANLYAENICYLPSVIAYSTSKVLPDVNELPALSAGKITFGSFNRLSKISEETLDLWARVLQELPESKIVLKAAELDDEVTRKRMLSHFEAAGISPERITMLGKTSWFDHLEACNLVDIALDPVPHGGGVTTIENMLMGAPVLTLRYPSFAGRVSASILTTLGLTGWIAESPEDYIRIAIEKSRDLAALSELRQNLRNIFSSSILGDPDYYLRAAEKEYRALWRRWCAARKVS